MWTVVLIRVSMDEINRVLDKYDVGLTEEDHHAGQAIYLLAIWD